MVQLTWWLNLPHSPLHTSFYFPENALSDGICYNRHASNFQYQTFPFYIFLNQIHGFLTVLGFATNLSLIFCIAFDRLLLVVFSHRFPPSRRRTYTLILMSWSFGLMLASLAVGGILTHFVYDPSTKHCSPYWEDPVFRICCIVLNFAITVPTLTVCYVVISYYIWREGKRLKAHQAHKSTFTAYVKLRVNECQMYADIVTLEVKYLAHC